MLSTTTKFTGPTAQGTRFWFPGEEVEMTFTQVLTALRLGGILDTNDMPYAAWDEAMVPMIRRGEILVTVWGVDIDPVTVW